MALSTTGTTANSWLSLDDANLILVDVYDASIPAGFQLETDHLPHLLEAARIISACWSFKGYRTDASQTLAWPRKCVTVPGQPHPGHWHDWAASCLPGWDPEIAYHINYESPGLLANAEYPDDEIPADVKEAQAILAALLVQGVNVFEDNRGDVVGVQLGPIKTDFTNRVAKAATVFQRLSRWGKFIGGHVSQPGGARA